LEKSRKIEIFEPPILPNNHARESATLSKQGGENIGAKSECNTEMGLEERDRKEKIKLKIPKRT